MKERIHWRTALGNSKPIALVRGVYFTQGKVVVWRPGEASVAIAALDKQMARQSKRAAKNRVK